MDPALGADVCPAFWRPEDNPSVVLVAPSAVCRVQLETALRARTVLVRAESEAGLHLVLAGRHARHRLLITHSAAHGGYIVPPDGSISLRLAALSAFHEGPRSRQAVASRPALKPSPYQRHRLALLLGILDKLEKPSRDRATIRQIADELVFPGRASERAIDWKSSSRRRHVQRLVAEARRMMATGYRDLLLGTLCSSQNIPKSL